MMPFIKTAPWLALALGTAACSTAESTERPPTDAERPVRFDTVRRFEDSHAAVFPARVRSERRPALRFRIPGRIVEISVDVGAEVQPGDVLARLDPNDVRTRLTDAEAAVAQAEADARNASRQAARAGRLFAGQAVSEAERDRTQDLAKAAEARLASARQRLELAQRQLAYTSLVAPQAGVVVERLTDPGADAMAGQPILQLSGERLEVRTDVPESALSEATVGGAAEVRIPALGPDFRPATVVRVAKGTADRAVLYPVFVRLTEAGPRLVPGMAAQVRFPRARAGGDGLLAVPPSAVVADPDGAYVWILEPLNGGALMTVRRRSVVLARLTGRAAVISKGLEAGERVATAGTSYLFAGQKVRPARLAPLVFEGVHSPASGRPEIENR